MTILNHFQILPFLLGIVTGIVMLYFYKPEPVILYKYPHPSNVNGRTYKDKNEVCYHYTSKEVNCDENEGTLKPYPLQ